MAKEIKKNRPRVADLILKSRIEEEEDVVEDMEDVAEELQEESQSNIKLSSKFGNKPSTKTVVSQATGQVVLAPEEDEVIIAQPVVEVQPQVGVTELPPEDEDDNTSTIGSMFLNRLFKFDPNVAHRVVADLLLTDLLEVSDNLRGWYSTQKPSDFASYELAKSATFQYLIKTYEEFDVERNFAHAVAHWFVNSLGLRKQR